MIFQHYRELVTADSAGKWFGIQPMTRKGKERKTEAKKSRKPKVEPENMIPMPIAAVGV